MLDSSVNILDELDNVSKIHTLERDDIEKMMLTFAQRILANMHLERISVWLFNNDHSAIISIGEYDIRTKEFTKNTTLYKNKYPSYFEAMMKNKIIIAENVLENEVTLELAIDYSMPNNVRSLMDVPIRIEGDVIGVMCFEKTEVQKIFNEKDQTFAYSLANVFASNMEARYRRAVQHKLKKALEEKELLIQEINHRVKNNFAILIGLLRISKQRGGNLDISVVFDEFEQRIFSMLKIHELLYKTKNYTSINLSGYLQELAKEFGETHPNVKAKIEADVRETSYYLPTKTAIQMGLIVTEIFINALKYADPSKGEFKFVIRMTADKQKKVILSVGDNGAGFDFDASLVKDTLGLQLIKNLVQDAEIKADLPNKSTSIYTFYFK